jgi:hypothetical protein
MTSTVVAARDASLGAHALGRLQRALEQRVQIRPGCAALMRDLVRLLHLSGDLPLADDHAVQAGGNAEQVPRCRSIGVFVQVRQQLHGGNVVKLAQQFGDYIDARRYERIGAGQVELDAIAGAQDHRLAAVADTELVQSLNQLFAVEG